MFHTALLPLSCFLSFSLTRISSPGCVWVFWNSDDNSIQIGEWMKADRWRDTNRKPCWCPVCQSPLIHVQTLDGSETKKKLDPIYFTLLLAFHFLWLAPVCLSTAELLAASNQCVHCSLLPPLLSSFFLSLLPSLSFCQTGQILETCIIRSSQDAGGKVDLQRPIESTYPSSLSNPQPAAPADRSPMASPHGGAKE